jgi:hypothetical protein
MNIYKSTTEFLRWGDGVALSVGKKLAIEAGARPGQQQVRLTIRKVKGECILTARWTPQYPAPGNGE